MPKLSGHTFKEFILSFKLINNAAFEVWPNLSPLFIERVSILVNSNSIGLDLTDT